MIFKGRVAEVECLVCSSMQFESFCVIIIYNSLQGTRADTNPMHTLNLRQESLTHVCTKIILLCTFSHVLLCISFPLGNTFEILTKSRKLIFPRYINMCSCLSTSRNIIRCIFKRYFTVALPITRFT